MVVDIEQKSVGICLRQLLLVPVIFIFVFLSFLNQPVSAQDSTDIELKMPQERAYKLKAYLIGRIPKHIDWANNGSITRSNTNFVLSVIGKNPFDEWLNKVYETRKKILNKNVKVRYITDKDINKIEGTHLLFISRMSGRDFRKIIEYTRDKPILTVSDTDRFTKQGVHINISESIKSETGKFFTLEVDETAVRRSGLMLRKGLLKNSKEVKQVNPYNVEKEKAWSLEKIADSIQWPSNDSEKTFTISVFGSSPVYSELRELLKRKKVNNKRVRIRRISTVSGIAGTNLLFISKSEIRRIANILTFTRNKPIFTVGETDELERAGLHCHFIIQSDRLRLDVDTGEAEASGLKINLALIKNDSAVQVNGTGQ